MCYMLLLCNRTDSMANDVEAHMSASSYADEIAGEQVPTIYVENFGLTSFTNLAVNVCPIEPMMVGGPMGIY